MWKSIILCRKTHNRQETSHLSACLIALRLAFSCAIDFCCCPVLLGVGDDAMNAVGKVAAVVS